MIAAQHMIIGVDGRKAYAIFRSELDAVVYVQAEYGAVGPIVSLGVSKGTESSFHYMMGETPETFALRVVEKTEAMFSKRDVPRIQEAVWTVINLLKAMYVANGDTV